MDQYVRVDDLIIQQGDDRSFTWTLKDTQGQPVVLAGYTVKAQVREVLRPYTLLHEWSSTNGRAVLGNSSVTLLVDDSEEWDWDYGVYDIQIIDPTNKVEVIARGSVTVTPAITK